jgi:hypothetical protein
MITIIIAVMFFNVDVGILPETSGKNTQYYVLQYCNRTGVPHILVFSYVDSNKNAWNVHTAYCILGVQHTL